MINLEDYGWKNTMLPEDAAGIPARVTAVHRERYELVCEHGFAYGKLKTANYYGQGEDFPTVGDFVLIQYELNGDSLILRTLPRKSHFSRRDPAPGGHFMQTVAANFDTCFVMTSLNRDFNLKRLERYLTAAWQSGAVPVVVLTKADIAEDFETQLRAVINMAAAVDVIPASAVSMQGVDRLLTYLTPGKTAVFMGSSGVGKSSLVNAMAGEDLMAVNTIREDDSRGRHTTTHRELVMLKSGGMVIDTPGMRQMGMWDVSEGLGEAFSDVEAVISRGCRFADCRHESEPGCAVKAALADGEITQKRWKSYLNLLKEAKYADNKSAFMRERQRAHKEIAMFSRQGKKDGRIKK